ncbi:MAG: trypsin-like serine protease, partial [Deltaproteobacteria bacterium]|nr:trypsin-like serine protease [Deltaproteobacteria bacterium]
WQHPGDHAGANQLRVGMQLPYDPATAQEHYDYQQNPATGAWTSSVIPHEGEWVWFHPRYDVAILQVAGAYKGATMPIRWDAPTESAGARWYAEALIRFSGYGIWPQADGSIVDSVRNHGKALWDQQVTNQNGPGFQLQPDPSGGCSGDSGGPAYILRRPRHRDGYTGDDNYIAWASLIGVLSNGDGSESCNDGPVATATYLDRAWISEIVCGAPNWDFIQGSYYLKEAVSRQRLLKVGQNLGPDLDMGDASSLEPGQLPRRDKGIVCAYQGWGQTWYGLPAQGAPYTNEPIESVATVYERGLQNVNRSLFFWSPLDGPAYAGSYAQGYGPKHLAAGSYDLFAVSWPHPDPAYSIVLSYDLSLTGGCSSVDLCVDTGVIDGATSGLFASAFGNWP